MLLTATSRPGRARRTAGALGILGAAGLLLAAPGAAHAAPAAPGPVTGEVRAASGPTVDALARPGGGAVVARVATGTRVAIRCQTSGPAADGPFGRSRVWDRVRIGGRVAYLSDASVFTGSDALVADVCGPAAAQGAGRTKPGRVGTQSLPLSVRRGPGPATPEVGKLAPGTKVRISCQTTGPAVTGTYGTSTTWNRVTYPVTGFIPDAYTYTGSDGRVAKDCRRAPAGPATPPTDDQDPGQGGGPKPGQAEQGRCTQDVPFALEPAPASTEAFVDRYHQAASRSDRRTGVPAAVTLGQGILESGSGAHTAGANNFFGIKASAKGGGIYRWGDEAVGCVFRETTEVVNGQSERVLAAFRLYRTAKDSFVDHAEFLVENPRYASAFGARNDSKEFIRRVHRAGYATDPAYSTSVIGLMDRYRLYRFDVR
ncbi:glucosaminidase domain-containing protein [Patulibacter minatonensis]|uniref:glucosaminidase domain-containing protein n=1 Tax=Patulibacter minatonensis TaxID=298163 RepID=UPI000687029E|nr:glucosaminidase domain-containing protein [Patulibacter minatonensis]